jgi:16S rRNA (cytosine1402-N4)-methyltransferase
MKHLPVMREEVLSLLKTQEGELCFLDATFGRGGHSRALLESFPQSTVIALDRDSEAVEFARTHMDYGDRFKIMQERFSRIESLFPPESFSGIILDVGVSSPQLDCPERGFSFMNDGPLDMRMSKEDPTCAADLINQLPEDELKALFFEYGEERWSRRIARAIVEQRVKSPITTTGQLSSVILSQIPRRSKHHPATRVFQALRIAVNQELHELNLVLPMATKALKPGGCLIVLSFQSLEDRIVKRFFKESLDFEKRSKKPLRSLEQEIQHNPRSRSACLRYGIRYL